MIITGQKVSGLLSETTRSKYPWTHLQKDQDFFFVPENDMPLCFRKSDGKQGRPHCPPSQKDRLRSARLAVRTKPDTFEGQFGCFVYTAVIK